MQTKTKFQVITNKFSSSFCLKCEFPIPYMHIYKDNLLNMSLLFTSCVIWNFFHLFVFECSSTTLCLYEFSYLTSELAPCVLKTFLHEVYFYYSEFILCSQCQHSTKLLCCYYWNYLLLVYQIFIFLFSDFYHTYLEDQKLLMKPGFG